MMSTTTTTTTATTTTTRTKKIHHRQQQIIRVSWKRMSPLQRKGMRVLSLIVLAESVRCSNAVSFWSKLSSGGTAKNGDNDEAFYRSILQQQLLDGSSSHPQPLQALTPTDCPNSTPLAAEYGGVGGTGGPGSCTNPSPLPASWLIPRAAVTMLTKQRLTPTVRKLASDCCQECSNCMEPSVVQDQCGLDIATTATATAAAAVSGAAAAATAVPRGGGAAEETVAAAATATAAATPYGIPLNAWKVLMQALLTSINVLCWLMPLRNKKISENKLALSLANAFSGGVFLSLAFGHLIPECVESFPDHLPDTVPFLLVLVGYLLIFFVEKVAFDAHDILHQMEEGGGGGGQQQQQEASNAPETTTAKSTTTTAASSHKQQQQPRPKVNGVVQNKHGKSAAAPAAAADGNSEEGESKQTAPHFTGGSSAKILLGALAVHSVLEMMALGLADSFGDAALLTVSIALHQPAESIALLVAFIKSGMPPGQIVQFLSVFACMGPIGVALGMAVNEFAPPVFDATMLAVVAGTFVYVGATEVIPEEWEEPDHKWTKFAALMSGIVSILVITQYTMTLHVH